MDLIFTTTVEVYIPEFRSNSSQFAESKIGPSYGQVLWYFTESLNYALLFLHRASGGTPEIFLFCAFMMLCAFGCSFRFVGEQNDRRFQWYCTLLYIVAFVLVIDLTNEEATCQPIEYWLKDLQVYIQ